MCEEEAKLGAREEDAEDACLHKGTVLPANLPHILQYVFCGSWGQKPGSPCGRTDAERYKMLLSSFDAISGDRGWCRKDASSPCGAGTRKDCLLCLHVTIKRLQGFPVPGIFAAPL